MTYQLHVGCCEDILKTLPDNSVDAIVTDPPYGLSFMNHKWDYDVPTVEQWQECLRVLKPGGHLLAFGGSRTYHRLVVNAEDAGFEIRDQILWIYGSGFPKSHNLDGEFDGWGTALKPAHEPIVMARKPFKKTVSANMAEHGTGAININACRIPTDEALIGGAGGLLSHQRDGTEPVSDYEQAPEGRWPANIIHDGSDVVVSTFPDAKGQQGALTGNEPSSKMGSANCYGKMDRRHESTPRIDSSKSAARFFYCAKVKPKERDEGLERFITMSASDMTGGRKEGSVGINDPRAGAGRTNGAKNNHPTVKPIALMSYLCRMITPPGGTVLDPWMGSGSTGRAAIEEGFNFIGIDLNPDYVTIASARIAHSFKKTKEAA
ncbi:site-specific DNA-methyltransferase [Salmonella enterica]|nr:site-specific DNA-methyltransferase [Salmonella enterica]EDW4356334.1 site-specific DNA-methyltransferase [Salmonella enterica subsp. salamae]HCM1883110.1 site-specific DNA-methyltransferase [Salmonella enterica subsp. salamae serovar 60:z10:z39]EAX8455314.1 site-specific DNA-methyltransferase [Salmonella enterica]EAX8553286.1 site-specific DNA-methyltransferase [Salmonella enterica]